MFRPTSTDIGILFLIRGVLMTPVNRICRDAVQSLSSAEPSLISISHSLVVVGPRLYPSGLLNYIWLTQLKG